MSSGDSADEPISLEDSRRNRIIELKSALLFLVIDIDRANECLICEATVKNNRLVHSRACTLGKAKEALSP